MSQRGASRWAYGNRGAQNTEDAWSVRWTRPEQILTHYYTGIHIRDAQDPLTPSFRWSPLQIDWGAAEQTALLAGSAYSITLQVQNTGVSTWDCTYPNFNYALTYRWIGPETYDGTQSMSLCGLAPGAATFKTLTLADVPVLPGAYTLRFDVAVTSASGNFRFSEVGWPAYSVGARVCATTGCVRQPRQRDIAFVIDTTGSMDDDIAAVQAAAAQIVNTIATSGDDYRVALIDFRDFPYWPYGDVSDYPAQLALDFTADQPTIINAINGLTIGYGEDWPESVYSGVMEAVELQWRADAEKLIILMGDAPPHDPEPETGYTSDSVIAAANAGGTPMQLGLMASSAMTTTAANGTPIHIYPVLIGDDTDAEAAFLGLADGTGGMMFQAATATEVTGVILDAISTAANAPTADAGGPYSASLGQPLTFTAANSFDPDGAIAFYEWDFESDGVFDVVTAEATTTYTYTTAFSGMATLRVTDASGVSATALAQVNVTSSSSGSVTFLADADARVEQENPTSNYGTSGTLRIEASDPGDDEAIESYVQFTVAGLQGPIQQAKLRLYATTNGTTVGSEVYGVTGNWTETGITWDTRPSRAGTPIATSGGVSAGSWVEYDVTSLVTGNGSFSFALVAPSDDGVSFSSREGAALPELVITAAEASLPNPRSFVAEADARVEASTATSNYGTSNILKVDSSPAIESYLRFTVAGVSGTVQSAKLRLYVGSNGTSNGPAVYTTDASWSETSITWDTRPSLGNTSVANVGATGTNGWVEYDVTAVVTGDGSYAFALVGESSDDATFESRQGNNRPQLLLTLTP